VALVVPKPFETAFVTCCVVSSFRGLLGATLALETLGGSIAIFEGFEKGPKMQGGTKAIFINFGVLL